MKIYKVFNLTTNTVCWCYEDALKRATNNSFCKYDVVEIATEPEFIPRVA